jgi:hypothetical protein
MVLFSRRGMRCRYLMISLQMPTRMCPPGRPACQQFRLDSDDPTDTVIQRQRLKQADSNCRQTMSSMIGRWIQTMRPTTKSRRPRGRQCIRQSLFGSCTCPPRIARRCRRWGPTSQRCTCSHPPSRCRTESSRRRDSWSTRSFLVVMRTSRPRTRCSPPPRRCQLSASTCLQSGESAPKSQRHRAHRKAHRCTAVRRREITRQMIMSGDVGSKMEIRKDDNEWRYR